MLQTIVPITCLLKEFNRRERQTNNKNTLKVNKLITDASTRSTTNNSILPCYSQIIPSTNFDQSNKHCNKPPKDLTASIIYENFISNDLSLSSSRNLIL